MSVFQFNCTDECPEHAPYRKNSVDEAGVAETVCVSEESKYVYDLTHPQFHFRRCCHGILFYFIFRSKASVKVILISVFVAILLIGLTVVIVAFWCSKRARALESKERLAARMSGMCEDSEISVNNTRYFDYRNRSCKPPGVA